MRGGKQPGPDHPITIQPVAERMIVRLGDAVLADSGNALLLREADYPPVFYFPRDEVAMELLAGSDTSTHCPYKGDASYFSARDGDHADIAWSYEDPYQAMASIKDHLAFYPGRVDAIETASRA